MFRSALPFLTLAFAACAPRYAGLPPLAPGQLDAPALVQHIEVDGVDVAWIDTGGSGPPVVLVHGLSSWMDFWRYQVEPLARDHRVIALDLPGYGASGRPDAPCTPPWYAGLIADWMEAVGAPHATVMGHSMGGQIAMTLAIEHPERVDALVLSAPAGFERFTAGEAATMKAFWHEGRAAESSEQEVRAAFVAQVFNRHDDHVEQLLAERVRLGLDPSFVGTSAAVSRSIAGMVDHPVFDRLGAITVPTLIVYGTEDRMIPNPLFTGGRTVDVARKGQRAIAGSELVMLKGAGHTVHHDDPEGFNAAVLDFLARVHR